MGKYRTAALARDQRGLYATACVNICMHVGVGDVPERMAHTLVNSLSSSALGLSVCSPDILISLP